MKSLFAQGGRAVVAEIPDPVLRPGEVLVAPAFSTVSAGTETSVIERSADPAHVHDHDYPGPEGLWPWPDRRRPAGTARRRVVARPNTRSMGTHWLVGSWLSAPM